MAIYNLIFWFVVSSSEINKKIRNQIVYIYIHNYLVIWWENQRKIKENELKTHSKRATLHYYKKKILSFRVEDRETTCYAFIRCLLAALPSATTWLPNVDVANALVCVCMCVQTWYIFSFACINSRSFRLLLLALRGIVCIHLY